MSEITTASDRDERSGRFVSGNSGGPGRKSGSRNKLSEQFVADLADCWQRHGIQALEACAINEPSVFVRVIANLLPRDVDINVSGAIDVADFATRFRDAVELLGNEPPQRRSRVIEHDDAG